MDIEVSYNSKLSVGLEQAKLIQDQIDSVHESGGGIVTLNAGDYICSTIFLRSNVELHLKHGCTIQAHHNLDDYPRVEIAADNKDQTVKHLIVAQNCKNVTISGEGTIDGQDMAFWEPCKNKEERPFGIFRYKIPKDRPSPLIQIVACEDVKLKDFNVKSSPGWALHVFDCDLVSINGLNVRGHKYGPNTDGIGINGSRDVRISHCDVDTGDDAIIIKATNTDSVCERVTVDNCVLASNCAALGLGADVYGVIRDVVFSNCVVKKSLRMIQVEMWFPGQVERAIFSSITGKTFSDEGVDNERPIYIDIQQFKRPEPTLGKVNDMIFRDIICESRGRIVMTAQDGSKIKGITLDTVKIIVPQIEDPKVSVGNSTSLQLSNFNPETRDYRAGVVADNCDELTLNNVEFKWPENSDIEMNALCTRNCEALIDNSPRLKSNKNGVARVVEL
jgi:hypothetical protein